MKAPAFQYARPASLAEAFALLDEYQDDARIIAGGQTLLATLNMRLSEPRMLVDLRDVRGLRGISLQRDHVRIGALTRHSEIEDSALVARSLPLLAMAAPHVAHRAIRNRGTIGGALAYADPAAEWPACALALDATFVVRSVQGERRIKAADFFMDLYTTALAPGEILIACEFPITLAAQRFHFNELVRRHGDYAIVGVAACARIEHGMLVEPRFAFMGASTVPLLARMTSAALEGVRFDAIDDALASASAALEQELGPIADLYNSAETKLHLARVLLKRAVMALVRPQASGAADE
jgi:carbon-monoxide dehydrogenase medium subunit